MAKTTINGRELAFDPQILANPTLDQILAMISQTGMGYDRYIGAFTAMGDSHSSEQERMSLLLGSKDGIMSCRIAVWLIMQANHIGGVDGPLTIDEANEHVGVLDFLNLLMASGTSEDTAENPGKPATDGGRAVAGHHAHPNASKATSGKE